MNSFLNLDTIVLSGGLPEACSYDCGRVYTGFLRDCHETMEATMEHLGEESRMKDYTEFNDVCADQDPVTLVRAITRAHCWACGDEKLDEEHGEECEPPNMENGCTDECKLVVCPALLFDADRNVFEMSEELETRSKVWQIPEAHITFESLLAAGAFGEVWRGAHGG